MQTITRIIILAFMMVMVLSAEVFAEEQKQDIFVNDSINISSEYKIKATSNNEEVAAINENVIKGLSAGNATINIKEKKLLWTVSEQDVKVSVYEGCTFQIEPKNSIDFEPVLEIYDMDDKEIQTFSVNEKIRLFPGTYSIKEKTNYSILSESPLMIELKDGQDKKFSIKFSEPSSLVFKASDERSLLDSKISIWKKDGEKYEKYKETTIGKDGKSEKLKLLPGKYWWCEEGLTQKIKEPSDGHIKYDGKVLYPFSLSKKGKTIKIRPITVQYDPATVEDISFSGEQVSNIRKIYEDVTQLYGCSHNVACAIIGNMYGESGIRTNALEDGGGGHGLCQWTGSRWENLKEYAESQDKDWTNIEVQVDFLMQELQGMNMDEFWAAPDIETATELFMKKFERPAEWVYETSLPTRVSAAQAASALLGGNNK